MFVFRRCTTLWSRLGVLAISVHGCDLPQHSFLLDIKVLGVCLFGYVLFILRIPVRFSMFVFSGKGSHRLVTKSWHPTARITRLSHLYNLRLFLLHSNYFSFFW